MSTQQAIDRSILVLERIWDELQSTAAVTLQSNSRSQIHKVAGDRLACQLARMRELLVGWQYSASNAAGNVVLLRVRTTFVELMHVLEVFRMDDRHDYIAFLHRAQETVRDALHDLHRLAAKSNKRTPVEIDA